MSQNQSESKVKITVARKGPLRVADPDGELQIEWNDGEKVTPPNPKMFALCRCGASSTQPFCDGTHTKIGFQAAEAATGQSEE